MLLTRTDPIPPEWSDTDETAGATAVAVAARLARLQVADIDAAQLPFLAAAAAELASVAGISWRFSTDDPAVALLRVIARVAISCPEASGPHAARLLAQLR